MASELGSSMQAMPHTLAEIHERLQQEVSNLHAKWRIFRQLYTVSQERIGILRKTTPGFFGLIQRVLLDDISLTISRLTDPLKSAGKENLSLALLVESASSTDDTHFRSRTQRALEDLQEHCAPFRAHRNRKIAHRDLPTALEYHPEPLPSVDGEKIDNALKMIAAFMNDFQNHYEQTSMAYEHVVISGDANDLVYFLEQAVEYGELKFKRLRG
jgi:hypothetical protein